MNKPPHKRKQQHALPSDAIAFSHVVRPKVALDEKTQRFYSSWVSDKQTDRRSLSKVLQLVLKGLIGKKELVNDLLESSAGGSERFDELQAYSQQVWYCLHRGAWAEALDLAQYAIKDCAPEPYPLTFTSLTLGYAFALMYAAHAIEIEAFQSSNREDLATAVEGVTLAENELRVLLKLYLSTPDRIRSFKLRIDYALACALALKLRLAIEIESRSIFPPFALPKNMDEARREFIRQYRRNAPISKRNSKKNISRDEQSFRCEPPYSEEDLRKLPSFAKLQRIADEALKLVDRCLLTAFMKDFAVADPDLLALSCLAPWKEQFAKEIVDGSHLRDFKFFLKDRQTDLGSH